jgi:hypothetical protein
MSRHELIVDNTQANCVFNKYRTIRIPKHMEKRKRRPGGGRKPGEFGKLGAVMSLRLPEDLRDQLKQAGKRNRRSMSAELIFRAKDSFRRDRAEKSPSQFAQEVYQRLRALFEDTAGDVAQKVEPKWRKK